MSEKKEKVTEQLEDNTSKKNKWKINWTTDKIMSTSALFISVISLIALLYQSYLAREENKLIQKQQSASVLPYLSQWYSDYNGDFKLIIGNKGVGPAFIKKVDITLDSTRIFNNTNELFKEIFKTTQGLDTIPFITSAMVNGLVLPANDKINLIEISGIKNSTIFKGVLNSRDIQFAILYEDIYGSQWLLTNKENSDTTPVKIDKD